MIHANKIKKHKWFKKLMGFLAGIEGILSTLLRAIGLKRYLWKGHKSFKSYHGLGILTHNLVCTGKRTGNLFKI